MKTTVVHKDENGKVIETLTPRAEALTVQIAGPATHTFEVIIPDDSDIKTVTLTREKAPTPEPEQPADVTEGLAELPESVTIGADGESQAYKVTTEKAGALEVLGFAENGEGELTVKIYNSAGELLAEYHPTNQPPTPDSPPPSAITPNVPAGNYKIVISGAAGTYIVRNSVYKNVKLPVEGQTIPTNGELQYRFTAADSGQLRATDTDGAVFMRLLHETAEGVEAVSDDVVSGETYLVGLSAPPNSARTDVSLYISAGA